jgi:hypothetical protein
MRGVKGKSLVHLMNWKRGWDLRREEWMMSIIMSHYNGTVDYTRVDHFLIEHYQPGNKEGNWIQPAWEYMHSHSFLDKSSLGKIGIWEDAGKIVAVVHYEWALGEAYFQFHPAYRYLRQEMLDYADENLSARSKVGGRILQVFVNDNDVDFGSLVRGRGYEKGVEGARPMYQFAIPDPFPSISLPAGYRLKSLAEDCDWVKIHRVLWRGSIIRVRRQSKILKIARPCRLHPTSGMT